MRIEGSESFGLRVCDVRNFTGRGTGSGRGVLESSVLKV